MALIIENWYLIFIGILLIIYLIYMIINQGVNFTEWLKYGVSFAEKELGSGTGQLKLVQVYDMAVVRFPWLARIISYKFFKKLVDDALDWMREQLAKNPNFLNVICPSKDTDESN